MAVVAATPEGLSELGQGPSAHLFAAELAGDAPDTPTKGDVNCDTSINSIDAALVLQLSAAMVASLPCDQWADINDDGSGNAVDASLILQLVAGLIGDVPMSTATVDPGLDPAMASIPGVNGGPARPLSALSDGEGNKTDFVSNELIVMTDSQSELNAILSRWNGELIETIDFELTLEGAGPPSGNESVSSIHLVRIDPARANGGGLAEDLAEIDPSVRSDLRFSDANALGAMAAAANETAGGATVLINPIMQSLDFRSGTAAEAPTGPVQGGMNYDPNSFHWPYMNRGSVQDIGVADAWRALDLAGRLDNKSDVAVIDGGFAPNPDFPEGWQAIGDTREPNGLECTGGSSCPWHGTQVVESGFGVPDNSYGVAGPGGPVSDLVVVQHDGFDFWSILNTFRSFVESPDIINISSGARLPAAVCAVACQPMHASMAAMRATGTLVFAAAGNDSQDVERRNCVPPFDWPCWEAGHYVPCELAYVICVGGLAWNSTNKHEQSNYSSNPGDNNTVDIFGPYTLYVGPEPDAAGMTSPTGAARVSGGTSFSSPFVAGVAALIWASSPSLSPGGVEQILLSSAHTNGGPFVNRWVNAYRAVAQLIGELPPVIDTSFASGSVLKGDTVFLIGRADDPEDGNLPLRWESSIQGLLGVTQHPQTSLPVDDFVIGTHTITASATNSSGLTAVETFTLEVLNEPPDLRILSPDDLDAFIVGEEILLRASSRDSTEGNLHDDIEWHSSIDGDLGTGRQLFVMLSAGDHTITASSEDEHGEVSEESVDILVLDEDVNLRPTVQIINPEDGQNITPNQPAGLVKVTLQGTADDPEDGPLTGASLVWRVSSNGAPAVVVGTGESLAVELLDGGSCHEPWPHEITLTATDSAGRSRSDTVVINDAFFWCNPD